MMALSPSERALFRALATPPLIQDYLNTLSYNFEKGGETCRSPRRVIAAKCAHCLEGAYLAAALLWFHGDRPLLLDLRSTREDLDHVVALFKRHGCWGALSKTNHSVLRYREPVYRTVRELALSYFHEYFLDNGTKTLREYSKPFSLKPYGDNWITTEEDLWDIGAALDESKHYPILPSSMKVTSLRSADMIEITAGKLTEYTGR
ncbi:MAG TPA: hypothetical protein VG621_02815 [Candidatus Paceibacterota bacterium]|nr:hypothetical protein [Candidatus Paceibacterota bacterium]